MLINHEIQIACPVETVWAALIDINAWPRWNPIIQHAERLDAGDFKIGSEARLKQPAQKSKVWKVTDLAPGHFFNWETCGPFLSMSAKHCLTATNGVTLCISSVQLLGPCSKPLGPFLKYPIKRALTQENKALRANCKKPEEAWLPYKCEA